MISLTPRVAGSAVALLLSSSLVLQPGHAFANSEPRSDDPTTASIHQLAPLVNPALGEPLRSKSSAAPYGAGTASSTDETKMLQRLNDVRLKACVPVVQRNDALDQIARGWSSEMADYWYVEPNPYLEYELPDGWLGGNELVAAGYPSGKATMDAWLAESDLRVALLDPSATDVGIGFVRTTGDPYGTWATLDLIQYSEPVSSTFIDVRSWHKFHTEIEWMASAGISRGTQCDSASKFEPSKSTTREAMAAFLYRAAGSPKFSAPPKSPFIDVAPTHKFYKEIAWLAAAGVSGGWQVNGKKEFRPSLNITREAMAAFLYRMAGKPTVTLPSTPIFTDVARSSVFYKEITWMAKTGVSTGWNNGGKKEFRPSLYTERAAMSAFLYRYEN